MRPHDYVWQSRIGFARLRVTFPIDASVAHDNVCPSQLRQRPRVIRRCERTNAHRYRGVRCRKAEPTRWEGGSDHAREHTRAHMEGRTHSNA